MQLLRASMDFPREEGPRFSYIPHSFSISALSYNCLTGPAAQSGTWMKQQKSRNVDVITNYCKYMYMGNTATNIIL